MLQMESSSRPHPLANAFAALARRSQSVLEPSKSFVALLASGHAVHLRTELARAVVAKLGLAQQRGGRELWGHRIGKNVKDQSLLNLSILASA